MALYLLHELTAGYATDPRVRAAVDTREIWIVPSVNPDGAEFDVASGSYVFWRKNRQPAPRAGGRDRHRPQPQLGLSVGLLRRLERRSGLGDLPRAEPVLRAGDAGACATSSRRAGSGACSRSRPGSTFTPSASSCSWPYGYTTDDTAPGLDADQQAAFAAIGQSMAASNGYTPEQASDLYITDGSIDDWLWGVEGVFAFTFEMYPTTSPPGFYPPDEVIAAQTSRNREAVLQLLEIADCPYRAIGKEALYCAAAEPPPPPPPPVDPPPVVVPPPPASAPRALASALTSRAGVGADGRLRVRLDCRTTGTTRCRGTLTLKARLPGGRGRTTTIARRSYSVAAGRRTLTLRLRAPARRALRARGPLAATATVTTRQASAPDAVAQPPRHARPPALTRAARRRSGSPRADERHAVALARGHAELPREAVEAAGPQRALHVPAAQQLAQPRLVVDALEVVDRRLLAERHRQHEQAAGRDELAQPRERGEVEARVDGGQPVVLEAEVLDGGERDRRVETAPRDRAARRACTPRARGSDGAAGGRAGRRR